MNTQNLPLNVETDEDGISITELLAILKPHRKKLLLAWIGGTLIGYACSYLLPVVYTAEARIMLPQSQQSGLSALMSQIPGAGMMGGGGGLGKDPAQLYIGLFQTKVISNNIIQRFNLLKHYEVKNLEKARMTLSSNIAFSSGKDSLIKVEVNDTDPKLATTIANTYPDELNKLLQTLTLTEASRRRKFFEDQLIQSKQQLTLAEVKFKELQEQSGVLRLEDQGKAIIERISGLRAQIAAKQVQIQSLKISATDENSQLKRAHAELDALQNQLASLENSSDAPKSVLTHNTKISDLNIDKLPSKGMEYIRRFRELKYQETMYELMIKQYEIAKMEESRTTQTVQLVDPATVPEMKSKPKRMVVALISGIACLLSMLAYAFFKQSSIKSKN